MEILTIDVSNYQNYLGEIAAIHKHSYSNRHFTSSFSESKLREYNELLVRHSDLSLVAVSHDQVMGYLISGQSVSKGVTQFTITNRAYLIGRLAARPWVGLGKLRTLLFSTFIPQEKSLATYRLLSIATRADDQSRGVGTSLLTALEKQLAIRDIKMYGLSVRQENQRAIGFYERHGFRLEKVAFGSLYFIKNIGKQQ